MRYCKVVIKHRLFACLEYICLPETQPYIRVLVPFGNLAVNGVVKEVYDTNTLELNRLKPILEYLDTEPCISQEHGELLSWCHQNFDLEMFQCFAMSIYPSFFNNATNEPSYSSRSLIALEQDTSYSITSSKLTADQLRALSSMKNSLDHHQKTLIFGSAGSGKLIVCLHIISQILNDQKKVIILTPNAHVMEEIAIFLRKQFQVGVTSYKSFTTNPSEAFWKLQTNESKILVTTKYGVLKYLNSLGLIIVLDEHENYATFSLANQDHRMFCAKQIALKRAEIMNIPIILSSSTPSIDTYYLVKQERCNYIILGEAGILPFKVSALDLKDSTFMNQLIIAMKHVIQRGKKIVILNNYTGIILNNYTGIRSNLREKHSHPDSNDSSSKILLAELKRFFDKVSVITLDPFYRPTILKIEDESLMFPNQFTIQELDILICEYKVVPFLDFSDIELVIYRDIDKCLKNKNWGAFEKGVQYFCQSVEKMKNGEAIIITSHPEHKCIQSLIYQQMEEVYQHILKSRAKYFLPPVYDNTYVMIQHSLEEECINLANQIFDFLENYSLLDSFTVHPIKYHPQYYLNHKYSLYIELVSKKREYLIDVLFKLRQSEYFLRYKSFWQFHSYPYEAIR